MTSTERTRLLKFAVATYLSLLAVPLFGFRTTTSIAFSAIFVITYGSTRRGCLDYCVNRMLAQLIGVAIGAALYFSFRAIPFLPDYQRVALTMTAGLAASLYVKYRFQLPIAEFTMFTPAFLVLLMTPGNDLYPLLRLAYCGIGVLIGIGVNFFLYPPNHGRDTANLLRREEALLTQMMTPFAASLTLPEPLSGAARELDLLESQVTLSAAEWKSDIDHQKHRASEVSDYDATMARHRQNRACWQMMKQVDALSLEGGSPFQKKCLLFIRELFAAHLQPSATPAILLTEPEAILQEQPRTQEACLLLAALLDYRRTLSAAVSPVLEPTTSS